MSSPFDSLDDQLQSAVLGAFGQAMPVSLIPRSASQYAERALDPTRPACLINGIYSAGAADQPFRGSSPGEFSGTTRFASMTAEFWVPYSEVIAIPYEIAVGDLIHVQTRAETLKFGVSRIQRTDRGDMNLILTIEAPETAP